MVLSGQTIRRLRIITEGFRESFQDELGNSGGLSVAGYDITTAHAVTIPRYSSLIRIGAAEKFNVHTDILAVVHDKSTWARKGIVVQNTVLEPGWRGFLTVEITNHSPDNFWIPAGCAIAQVVFHRVDEAVEKPYDGKYQDQEIGPQDARSYETKAGNY